jgi:ABC-2 type transport system ATP-binding protein
MISTFGFFELKSDNLDLLNQQLSEFPEIEKTVVSNEILTAHLKEDMSSAELNQRLFKNNVVLTHLVKRKESLEEQFLQLTSKTN